MAKTAKERSVGFLLSDLSRLLRRNFDRRVQSLGLTQAQWRAMVHISRDEGTTQAALADGLEIQPITLARLIDRMEAAGWVERRSHPQDRRAVQLYLTPKAAPILEDMHGRAQQTIAVAVAGLSAATLKQVTDALLRMKHNLSAAEDAAAQSPTERNHEHAGRNSAKLGRQR